MHKAKASRRRIHTISGCQVRSSSRPRSQSTVGARHGFTLKHRIKSKVLGHDGAYRLDKLTPANDVREEVIRNSQRFGGWIIKFFASSD